MSWFLKYLTSVCTFALLANTVPINAALQGILEGHLKILSSREVELAGETPSTMTAENYADYPLIVLSRDKRNEIARVTADENGNYRVALAPGDYVLDVQRRGHGHIRARPQLFTINSNQTVHVDMNIDTGIR